MKTIITLTALLALTGCADLARQWDEAATMIQNTREHGIAEARCDQDEWNVKDCRYLERVHGDRPWFDEERKK